MPITTLFLLLAGILTSPSIQAPHSKVVPSAGRIVRLDGSTISTDEAERFARKTLEAHHVTGAQIMVLNNGKAVWSAAFGLRGKAPELQMDRQTMTWAASITKSVFATYVITLVDKGEFDLDTPIAKQLRRPLNEYEEYAAEAEMIVRDPAWLEVTPRMLLSHTSGLANFAFLEPDKKMHLHFKPGTQFRYSGQGINIVQLLIEEKKQRPLHELMQESLFTPLGMTRTAMRHRDELDSNIADRFDAAEKFLAKTRRSTTRASGSMTSSAEDLAKFASALLNDKLMRRSTRNKMLTPNIMIKSLHEIPLAINEPEGKEAQAVGLGYGIGWGLLTRTRFGPAIFKGGHGDGAQTYLICFEKSKSGIILLTNSNNGELAFRALNEFILGNTVTPWEWQGYTPAFIEASRKTGN